MPRGLREQRIVVGDGFLKKVRLLKPSDFTKRPVNYIRAVSPLTDTKNPDYDLAVFDHGNLWYVATQARSVRWVSSYKNAGYFSRPKLLDVDGDGSTEIICRGGGFSDVGVLKIDGEPIWTKSGSWKTPFTANSLTAGDLDRDGRTEFYVAAKDGLYRFNEAGVQDWKTDEEVQYWHVETSALVGQEQPEVFAYGYARGQGFIERRDPAGRALGRFFPKSSARFRIIRWPGNVESIGILTRTGSMVFILDTTGQIRFTYRIPGFGRGHGIEGTLIRFHDDRDPYLAVLTGTTARWRRSLLSIFSLDGELMYQEVLGATNALLATRMTHLDKSGEVLLVGSGIGTLWAYGIGE